MALAESLACARRDARYVPCGVDGRPAADAPVLAEAEAVLDMLVRTRAGLERARGRDEKLAARNEAIKLSRETLVTRARQAEKRAKPTRVRRAPARPVVQAVDPYSDWAPAEEAHQRFPVSPASPMSGRHGLGSAPTSPASQTSPASPYSADFEVASASSVDSTEALAREAMALAELAEAEAKAAEATPALELLSCRSRSSAPDVPTPKLRSCHSLPVLGHRQGALDEARAVLLDLRGKLDERGAQLDLLPTPEKKAKIWRQGGPRTAAQIDAGDRVAARSSAPPRPSLGSLEPETARELRKNADKLARAQMRVLGRSGGAHLPAVAEVSAREVARNQQLMQQRLQELTQGVKISRSTERAIVAYM